MSRCVGECHLDISILFEFLFNLFAFNLLIRIQIHIIWNWLKSQSTFKCHYNFFLAFLIQKFNREKKWNSPKLHWSNLIEFFYRNCSNRPQRFNACVILTKPCIFRWTKLSAMSVQVKRFNFDGHFGRFQTYWIRNIVLPPSFPLLLSSSKSIFDRFTSNLIQIKQDAWHCRHYDARPGGVATKIPRCKMFCE